MTTKRHRLLCCFGLGVLLASPFAPTNHDAFAANKAKSDPARAPQTSPEPQLPDILAELPGEPLRITIPSLNQAKQGADPATNRILHSLFSRLLERSQEREILAQPLPFLSIATPSSSLIYSVASRFIAVTNDTSHAPPAWERVLASAQANKLPFFSLLPQIKSGPAQSPAMLADASAAASPPLQVAEANPPQSVVATAAKEAKKEEGPPQKAAKEDNKKNERKLAKNQGKTKGEKRLAAKAERKRGEKQIASRTRTVPLLPVDVNDLPAETLAKAPASTTVAQNQQLAPETLAQLAPAAGTPFMDSDEPAETPEVQEQIKTETPRDDFSVVKLFDQLFPTPEEAEQKTTAQAAAPVYSLAQNSAPHTQQAAATPASQNSKPDIGIASATPASKPYKDAESFEAPATLVASTDSIKPATKEPRVEVKLQAQDEPALTPQTVPAHQPALEVQLSDAEADDVLPEPRQKNKNNKNKREKKNGKVVAKAQAGKNKKSATAAASTATGKKLASQGHTPLPWTNTNNQHAAADTSQSAAPAEEPAHPLAVIASLFSADETAASSTQPQPQESAPTTAVSSSTNLLTASNAPVAAVNAKNLASLAPAAGTEPPASSQDLDDMVLVPSTPETPAASTTPPPVPAKEALVPPPPPAAETPQAPAPAPQSPDAATAVPAQAATAPAPQPQAPAQPAVAAPATPTPAAPPAPPAQTAAQPATPSAEEEKKALLQSAPPAPNTPAVPAAPAPVASEQPAQIVVPASEGAPTPAPTPASPPPVAAAPAPEAPKTATAAPVEAVESKPVQQKTGPNARAMLLDAERQVKSKRGTSSKELLRKMPERLGDPEPQLPTELLEPFIVDRSKKGREIYDPTDDTQVQNAKSESLGVKIEIKSPRIDTNYELEKAYNALMSGQATVAQEIYRNVLDNDPNNVLALFGMATSYHRGGQFEKARTLYAKILSIDPNNRDALNNFLALVSSDAPEASLVQLERLEARNPEFSPIPAQMAVIYQKLGNHEKAMQKMLRAVSLEPENLTYRYNLAVLMDRQGRREEAASLYRQLVSAYQSGAIIPGDMQKIQERLTFLSSTPR